MDATKEDKQKYIQENIIDKGFDSLSFSQFLCKKSGQTEYDIDKIPMDEIIEGVQEFTNSTPIGKVPEYDASAPPIVQNVDKKEKKKNTIFKSILGLKNKIKKQVNNEDKNKDKDNDKVDKPVNAKDNDNIEEEKKEEKNYDYGFRLPEKIKCQSVEETEISQYKDLPIKIGMPEKVGKSIIKKKAMTYFTTIAVPLNKVVKRSFDDFEWLRLKLNKMFDSNFIPSLPKMNPILGINNDEQMSRSIEKFMHYLSLDPIIKNSQI